MAIFCVRGTFVRACLTIIVLLGSTPLGSAQAPRGLLPPPLVTEVKTLPQNWSHAEAEAFYSVPQGSKLVRLNWFLHLEQPDKEALFRDAEHIRALGYLPRAAGAGNPHGLPVGFVKDGLHLGMTCAACHTAQIIHQNKAWIVDGGPTQSDFESLLRRLAGALKATAEDKAKFKRFADKVLGPVATDTDRGELHVELRRTLEFRQGYNARNLPRGTAAGYGPGRVDAFGAIMNEVTSTFAGLPDNHAPADAPVSYPFLWDTPQHDFVQWNGAAENQTSLAGSILFGTRHVGALGRNAGEVMGVFGTVRVSRDGIVVPATYASSVNLPNLIDVEESLRKLWSPQWPAEFPPIVGEKRALGEALFKQHCAECHAPINRDDPGRTVKAWLKRSVETDPTMARNFLVRRAKTGAFQDQRVSALGLRRFGTEAPVAELLKHSVERVLLSGSAGTPTTPVAFHLAAPVEVDFGDKVMVGRFQSLALEQGKFLAGIVAEERRVADLVVHKEGKLFKTDPANLGRGRFLAVDGGPALTIERWSPHSTFSTEGSMVALKSAAPLRFVYKGRPLNGIWATAPYLHNGSVPNLDELLKKPQKRLARFMLGSQEFDPVRVGFRTDAGPFEFDAVLPGNSNAGHDYGVEFTAEQREQMIEYMKSL